MRHYKAHLYRITNLARMLTPAPLTAMTNSRDAAEPRQSCAVDRDGPAGRRTYGFYNTIVEIGILVGYLATETLVQRAADGGAPDTDVDGFLPHRLISAFALYRFDRAGRFQLTCPSSLHDHVSRRCNRIGPATPDLSVDSQLYRQ